MAAVIRREIRKRSLFGKIIKGLFYAFNLLMLIWLIGTWVMLGNQDSMTSTAKTGAGMLSAGFLAVPWLLGDAILGALVLATRGQKIIVEEQS